MAEKLKGAGAQVDAHDDDGVTHGFFMGLVIAKAEDAEDAAVRTPKQA